MQILRSLGVSSARAAAAASAALAALALVLLAPAPAFAHDALEGSAPASGATVATAPAEVRLDFGETPLGVGAQVMVKDPAGTDVSDGAPEVVDRSVHQKLRAGVPAGAYTVVWRVVSSDSHPIEGTLTFTVAGGSTTPASGAAASAAPGTPPGIQASQPGTPQTAPPAPAAQAEPFPWMIAVFAVVAVGLLAALGVGARHRLSRGDEGPEGRAED
ncbi:copper resistance CopC family protein [Sinomonas atrocyanea]